MIDGFETYATIDKFQCVFACHREAILPFKIRIGANSCSCHPYCGKLDRLVFIVYNLS